VTQDPSPIYSERLGAISDAQFAAAAARLGLGDFVSAEPVRQGLFGQNVFLTTSEGAFVFRGSPHWYRGQRDDRYQFAKEALFIDLVHAHTGAPAPWPVRYDPTSDIFGWPYLVMPRMPGDCFNERTIRKALPSQARREIAVSIGATLAELQRLSAPAVGDYDPDTGALAFHSDGYRGHLIRSLSDVAKGAEAAGVMSAADMDWCRELALGVRDLPARPVTFVHGDYKLDNMTVVERNGAWRVGGLFDFHTGRFGDSARDIVRAACAYRDTEPELAQVMIEAWRAGGGDAAGLSPWLPLYVASERSSIWAGFVKRDARPAWSAGQTFRSWAEGYLEMLTALL
jgi:aminoglycoside phosphotransferase (APT) family kinase protein